MYETAGKMQWENRRDLPFGSITGTYAPIGGPLLSPARVIKIVNTTDVDIDISDDGINDKDICPAGTSMFLYDISSNKTAQNTLYLSAGTLLYVKGSPTTGTVYYVVVFAI